MRLIGAHTLQNNPAELALDLRLHGLDRRALSEAVLIPSLDLSTPLCKGTWACVPVLSIGLLNLHRPVPALLGGLDLIHNRRV